SDVNSSTTTGTLPGLAVGTGAPTLSAANTIGSERVRMTKAPAAAAFSVAFRIPFSTNRGAILLRPPPRLSFVCGEGSFARNPGRHSGTRTRRTLATYCSSTALACSMDQHLVAAQIWNHLDGRPAKAMLESVAKNGLVLVSTGANDRLESNGIAEKVEGGFKITAKKPFASGGRSRAR